MKNHTANRDEQAKSYREKVRSLIDKLKKRQNLISAICFGWAIWILTDVFKRGKIGNKRKFLVALQQVANVAPSSLKGIISIMIIVFKRMK